MKKSGIPVKGLKLKDGKLIKAPSYRDVSAKIRARKSKRVKVVKRGKA